MQGSCRCLRQCWRGGRPAQYAPRKHHNVALHAGIVSIAGLPCLPERIEPGKRLWGWGFGMAGASAVHKVCVQQGLSTAGPYAQGRKHMPHEGAHMPLTGLWRGRIAITQQGCLQICGPQASSQQGIGPKGHVFGPCQSRVIA